MSNVGVQDGYRHFPVIRQFPGTVAEKRPSRQHLFVVEQIVAVGEVELTGQIVAFALAFPIPVDGLAVNGCKPGPDDRIILRFPAKDSGKIIFLLRLDVQKVRIGQFWRVGLDKGCPQVSVNKVDGKLS